MIGIVGFIVFKNITLKTSLFNHYNVTYDTQFHNTIYVKLLLFINNKYRYTLTTFPKILKIIKNVTYLY